MCHGACLPGRDALVCMTAVREESSMAAVLRSTILAVLQHLEALAEAGTAFQSRPRRDVRQGPARQKAQVGERGGAAGTRALQRRARENMWQSYLLGVGLSLLAAPVSGAMSFVGNP